MIRGLCCNEQALLSNRIVFRFGVEDDMQEPVGNESFTYAGESPRRLSPSYESDE